MPSCDVEQNRLLLVLPLFLAHFLNILFSPLSLLLSPSLHLQILYPYRYSNDPPSPLFYGYLMASSVRSKRSECESNHLAPSSRAVKYEWSSTFTHIHACVPWSEKTVPDWPATIITEHARLHIMCAVILVNWILFFYLVAVSSSFNVRIYDSENMSH